MESSLYFGSGFVLPAHKDLCRALLGFLDDNFGTNNSLSSISSTASALTRKHAKTRDQLDADLEILQRKLCKLVVLWMCLSIEAKTIIQKLDINSKSPSRSTTTSQYGSVSKMLVKMLIEELPNFVNELRRIENLRNYAETALKLEALVGDLEDAVLYFLCQNTKDKLSGFGSREEKALQAIKTISYIENALVTVAEHHPQWHHLTKSVNASVDKMLALLRCQVLAEHRTLLRQLGWPPKFFPSKIGGTTLDFPNLLYFMEGHSSKFYSQSFLLLCALQHLQAQREKRQFNLMGRKWKGNIRLWAIDELVSPIASRVEYHFLKWVDQPELIFALVYKITRDFFSGVEDVLQPLIDRAGLVGYSAKEAWVYAMVEMLSVFLAKKVFTFFAEKYRQKHNRSEAMSSWVQLIDLMVAFDRRMQSLMVTETLRFQEYEKLGGISVFSIFCNKLEWLKIWARIELKDAWKKFKVELKREEAWFVNRKVGIGFSGSVETCEYLLFSREGYKVPLIAEFALDIAWEMIARCLNLPEILPQIQFIRSTSIKFLRNFFNVLVFQHKKTAHNAGYPATDSLTRSCTLINVARYCESKLVEWSDHVCLLEMSNTENDVNILGNGDAVSCSCFFGEEIQSLAELETTWLMELITDLLRQFGTLSGAYVQMMEHYEKTQEETEPIYMSKAVNFTLSVEFVEALDTLRSQLLVIRQALNAKDFLDLWRNVANGLDHFIFCSILLSRTLFSDKGIKQLDADMQAVFSIFQPFCARPEAFFPCLSNSLVLLKINMEEVKRFLGVSLDDDDDNTKKFFHSRGISHISFDQAMKILRSRKV